MTKKKGKPDVRDSGQPSPLLGASPAELQQLSNLLQLIRSGSPLVQSLLSAGQARQAQPSAAPQDGALDQTPEPAQKLQGKETASQKRNKVTLVTAEPGWQVETSKRKSQATPTADTLVEVPEVVSPSNADVVENIGKLTRDRPCF